MDDLLGEDWQAPAKPTNAASLNPASFASNYSSLRASPQLPLSGTASPQNVSRPSSIVNGAAKPANDTFGSLLSLKAQKAGSTLSIQERQKQLLEERKRQQEQHAQLWDTLGSGRGTPEIRGPSPGVPQAQEDEDDILAAFNKAAPVDSASHFPPPSSTAVSGRNTPALASGSQAARPKTNTESYDEDDPFGLGSLPTQSNGHVISPPMQSRADDDNILGDLGRPVSARPLQSTASRQPTKDDSEERDTGEQDVPQDHSLTELVEMGFPADTAKIALAETGGDVQSAVGWLLQQAHEESKQKARADAQTRQRSPAHDSRSPPRRQPTQQDNVPAWMRQEGRSGSAPWREDSRSPANGERDAAQVAQELSSKLFKGANSLWKASQKQMAKTVAEFQQERDPSQPKWMQETSADASRSSSQRRPQERQAARTPAKSAVDATDEAAMLDMPRESRPPKPARPSAAQQPIDMHPRGGSPVEPLPHRPSPQPKPTPQLLPQQDRRPATKVSRSEVEDQTVHAYVSPARRKRPTSKPEPPAEPEVDLFSPPPAKVLLSSVPTTPAQVSPAPRSSPAPVRPSAPPRSIPAVSPSALATSARHRKAGGEAFKRGDYAAAHEAYTAALSPLPAFHPIIIVVSSNRSLTALKTGDAKTAISDADRALKVIGVSQGIGESIDLGAGEGSKDMRDFFSKALMRKAEALEHMEKWSEAAGVWRQAIGVGIGGAVSLRGRDRCEKAAAPSKPASSAPPVCSSAPAPRSAPIAKGLGNSMQRPAITSIVSAEAVKKLRAANAAAEKADDEKFALTDQVDARLTAWRGGKADNLRALLQSLDGVLWESAGWKKVGMSDLVMANKVKIVYMKAIGKLHPDKIPQDATTEQRMVSAAVFSTLNKAWDKFKTDNNL